MIRNVHTETVVLRGGPYDRGIGQAQACPDQIPHVRHAVRHRLRENAAALEAPPVRALLKEQRAFIRARYPEILTELEGIAAGFALEASQLFRYLHCGIAQDMVDVAGGTPPNTDPNECTSWAARHAEGGALLGKNRDYRAEHIPIQRMFRQIEAAPCGSAILCLGSLGSPGSFSSGMNVHGLALADTNSRTSDHGPGMLRYFLMPWLLEHCRTVDEAVENIRRIPHAGGGMLILADARGSMAAVELGHREVGVERAEGWWIGRSNHFILDNTAPGNYIPAYRRESHNHSLRRYPALHARFGAITPPFTFESGRNMLSAHKQDGQEGFCRHGEQDLGTTISGVLYHTASHTAQWCAGNPCEQDWVTLTVEDTA